MEKKDSIRKENEAKDSRNINLNNETPLIEEDTMSLSKHSENNAAGNNEATSEMELKIVPIDSITVSQHYVRTDSGDIKKLQGSMQRNGMQDPILVREIEPGRHEVIDGVRRFEAAKNLGRKEVPCLIKKELTDDQAAHLAYVKNEERKSYNPIEKARHIKTMRVVFGYTLDELGLKGYGSPSSISNKLKLLDLPDKVQREIQEGALTAAHGLPLTKLDSSDEQERMAKRVVDFDLTARVTEDRIDRYLAKKRKAKKVQPKEIVPSGDVPDVYFKDAREMGELPNGCVHLIVSSPPYFVGMEFEKGMTFKEHLANVQDVMKECARVLAPGGFVALNVADIINFKGNNGKSDQVQIQLMAHRYQSYLRKYGIYLTDVIIWAKRPAWSKNRYGTYKEGTVHTSYRIFDNWEPVYIFRKKGEREIPSEDIVLKSKLTREQWMAYVNGVWKIEPTRNTQGHPCMYPDELVNRLIRMFSYIGDTVLDPFLGSGTTVKVARELGRYGIGYERELQYKPVIMKKLGLIPEKAVDEGSETMAEFFERTIDSDSETSEPSVETIPVIRGKTFKGIESAEEFSEASMPV